MQELWSLAVIKSNSLHNFGMGYFIVEKIRILDRVDNIQDCFSHAKLL